MLKLAHIADLHVRPLERHNEYRKVLSNFIQDLKVKKIQHVVICGDLAHNKTTISSELVEFFTWFFRGMAEYSKVHITLGNHDLISGNYNRLDAISPIVDALAHPNIFMYKKSGVYPIENGYNLCVFAIDDEKEWENVKPIKNEVNIATFHGAVVGCKTDLGFEYEGGQSLDLFKNCEFTFLGDFHKTQYLNYRNTQKGSKPYIAYPGSTLQQNFGEDINRGYLLWEIENKENFDVKFCKLANSQPFITVEWNGSVDLIFDKIKHEEYPQGSRVKIKSDGTISLTNKEKSILCFRLKKELNASQIIFDIKKTQVKNEFSNLPLKILKDDIRKPEVLYKLLKEYYKGESNLKSEEWEAVKNLVFKYVNQCTKEDILRNANWQIKNLKFSNLFVYGEDNEINFEKLNGLTGIFAPNRYGKSSIVGSIMYALFNTTDRGAINSADVVNERKDFGYAKCQFAVNGNDYELERQTIKKETKVGEVKAHTSLNFKELITNVEAKDLVGDARTDTDKILRSLIGTAEDFQLTALSSQGGTNQFIELGSTQRKKILNKFLDLNFIDELFEIAKEELALVRNGTKSRSLEYFDENLNERKDKLKVLETQLLAKKLEKIKQEEFLEQEKNDLNSLNLGKEIITSSDVNQQQKKVDLYQEQLKENQDTINEKEQKIASFLDKMNNWEIFLEKNNPEKLKKELEKYNLLDKSLAKLKSLYSHEEEKLKRQKNSLKLLQEVPCGDDYPTCKFIKNAHQDKLLIEETQKKFIETANEITQLEIQVKALKNKDLQGKIQQFEKIRETLFQSKNQIAKWEIEIDGVKRNVEELTKKYNEENLKLAKFQVSLNLEDSEQNQKIKKQIENLICVISQINDELQSFIYNKGKLETEVQQFETEKEFFLENLQKLRIHELLTGAFSKKGIPNKIILSQLPQINSEISKILDGVVDFTVELDFKNESDQLNIFLNYGDIKRIIELGSGMEKFISALAIRVAMINISTLPKTDILIIDEGFGTLDQNSADLVNRFLLSLKKHFKAVLVITHIEAIKDIADHIIDISREENHSRVIFQ